MLVEGLQSYLAADTGLQALLGSASQRTDKTTGIFPVLAPSEVPMPYLVLQQISGDGTEEENFQGSGRLQTTRWRFSCYGTTYKQAKQVARALKSAMRSANGALPTGSAEVQGSWLRLEVDDAEPIPRGTLYGCHVDFEVLYRDNE